MLERIDWRVLCARTGAEAVEIARTHDGDIDLALLDVELPDMDGDKIYPLIMGARPDQKAIVCSGYTQDGPSREILSAGANGLLTIPHNQSSLPCVSRWLPRSKGI